MIATKVISPFLTPLKLALVSAIFLSMPLILYQAWAFVAPGLYKHERKMVIPLLVSSSLLFYAGMAFAYYAVFPLVFEFMSATTPEGITQAPDITEYLDFVLTIFFAFGLAFEVPIATVVLVWTGATTPESLVRKRPYIVVGAFVIGMMLTPPDVISQTLLAIPMLILFELGVFFSRLYQRKPDEDEMDEEDEASDSDDERPDPSTATDTEFTPMSEEEMEAELDRVEAEEASLDEQQRAAPSSEDAAALDDELDELGAGQDDLPDDPSGAKT